MYSKEYAPLKNCRPISQIATNNSHGFQTNPQSHPTSLITVPEIQYVTDVSELISNNIPSLYMFIIKK